MLKLIYTETDLHIEKLTASVEDWIGQRVLLALRVGKKVVVEPMNASFSLSTNLAGWNDLEYLICREANEAVALSICDADSIEIGLEGYWLASSCTSEEGVFVTNLPPKVETALLKMWQLYHCCEPLLDWETAEENC
jgi:hypothetical protein